MPERRLTEPERQEIRRALDAVDVAAPQTCRRAVEECVLVQRLPSIGEIRGPRTAVAYAALRKRAKGITLGRHVYLRADCVGHRLDVPLPLLAHELAHVAQYMRDGTVGFLTTYVSEYLEGLAAGLGDERAYLEISYEREARRVADRISAD